MTLVANPTTGRSRAREAVPVHFAPIPLREQPRGLTTVPPGHLEEADAAAATFAGLVDRFLGEHDPALVQLLFAHLYREHIRPLQQQLDTARQLTRIARLDLEAARAQQQLQEQQQRTAALKRAQQAERRDKQLRRDVYERDGDQCRYCAGDVELAARGASAAVLDHVDPDRVAGADNLVTACRPCARAKRGHTPDQVGMTLLPPPAAPRFRAQAEKEPEEPMTAPTKTDEHDQSHDQSGGRSSASGPATVVHIQLSYPSCTAEIRWTELATEPTPDEIVEMLRIVLPSGVAEAVHVHGAHLLTRADDTAMALAGPHGWPDGRHPSQLLLDAARRTREVADREVADRLTDLLSVISANIKYYRGDEPTSAVHIAPWIALAHAILRNAATDGTRATAAAGGFEGLDAQKRGG